MIKKTMKLKKLILCKRRKAQIEMIGLVMIVVIVVTGLLLFMVQKMSQPPKSIRTAYINRQTATNMLINLEAVNVVECNGLPLSTLIVDCARKEPGLFCDNDYSSCYIANQTILAILNRTLIEWGVPFSFSISSPFTDPEEFIKLSYLRCSSRDMMAAFEYLSLFSEKADTSETAEIKLKVCAD
jgi:hypothetical protein